MDKQSVMKTFTFEINGYCFYFECETWEQFQDALNQCGITPDPCSEGELVYSQEIEDGTDTD